MALCITHNISFDPQWEWCVYCGKPKAPETVITESTTLPKNPEGPLTCSLCQVELDRTAVCHHCWVVGPPKEPHAAKSPLDRK
jgi:hypothetical protein